MMVKYEWQHLHSILKHDTLSAMGLVPLHPQKLLSGLLEKINKSLVMYNNFVTKSMAKLPNELCKNQNIFMYK